jgi:diadenosine tetraphosphatase ApaH/serine/threonine PP2A family protein phosphatase
MTSVRKRGRDVDADVAAKAEATAAKDVGQPLAALLSLDVSNAFNPSLPRKDADDILRLVVGLISDWRQGGASLTVDRMYTIIDHSYAVLMAQPMLLRLSAPINICGDIHGQIIDLVSIFTARGAPPSQRYLFLGDYVDRGKHGLECIVLLLGLKVLFPDYVGILRGNHESESICRTYGFFDECKRRFDVKLYKRFTDVFNVLPVAACVEDVALCMHGGLSPELKSLSQIEQLPRPLAISDQGLACDLLWSDPDRAVVGFGPSERGVSFTFGEDVVRMVCKKLDVDLIVRAHQVVDNGYEFFCERRLVTVFSASAYCGEFTNNGAMLQMDQECRCSFLVFQPAFK